MSDTEPDREQPGRASENASAGPPAPSGQTPRERGYLPTVRRRAVLSGLAQERVTNAPARSGTNRLSGAPQPQRNRRPLLIAGLAVALVVALGLGVFAYSALNSSSSRAPAGSQPFYVDVDIPWATVTLDGAPVGVSPVGSAAPLVIAPGKHQIRWQAEPFQPQGCVFSVPAATGDTCPIEAAETSGLRDVPNARLLFLRASLASLSAAQQRALSQTLASVGGFTAPLQAGESYPTGPASEAITLQPANATLTVNLALNAEGTTDIGCQTTLRALVVGKCALAGRNCMQLCTAPWQMRAATPTSGAPRWLAFAVGRLSWTITTPEGRVVVQNQPVGFADASTAGHLIAYSITWENQAWRAQPLVGADLYAAINAEQEDAIAADPACAAAYEAILGPGEQSEEKLRLQFVSGPTPAAGCLVTISTLDAQGTPTPGRSSAKYLYRLKQILAANDIAHQMNPHVPAVSGSQKAVVDQLAGVGGQIIDVG
jgi:hypothetical protein